MVFSFIGGFNIATADNIKHRDVIELNELDKEAFAYAAEGIALAYKSGAASCIGDFDLIVEATDRTEEINKKIEQIQASRSAVIKRIGL